MSTHSMLLGSTYMNKRISPKVEQSKWQKKIIVHNLQNKFLHKSWTLHPPLKMLKIKSIAKLMNSNFTCNDKHLNHQQQIITYQVSTFSKDPTFL
jgi:hypothetical protein